MAPFEEKNVSRVTNFCVGVVVLAAMYAAAAVLLRIFRWDFSN